MRHLGSMFWQAKKSGEVRHFGSMFFHYDISLQTRVTKGALVCAHCRGYDNVLRRVLSLEGARGGAGSRARARRDERGRKTGAEGGKGGGGGRVGRGCKTMGAKEGRKMY